jgi:CheY-like chemotaxis protein
MHEHCRRNRATDCHGDAGGTGHAGNAQGGRLHRLSDQTGSRHLSRPRFSTADGFDNGAPNEPADVSSAALAGNGLSILCAEDNEINALLARALLEKLGHRSTMAGSGTAAIECWLAARAAGMPFDCVLMDLHMPGMDGLEATRRIRAFETEDGSLHTPIIALTANASAEEACLAAGMDSFLVKALDRERLVAALAESSAAVCAA